jgi:diguanylate cyclase (GGDEF)-like protein
MKILLVEDDRLLCDRLKASLIEQHYSVDVAEDGEQGWEFVESLDYDLIVLDVLLPKLDGISFCRRLRAKGKQVLVLLLTAKGTSTDKILGLDAGADDYVVKPVILQELDARIRALLRRKVTIASPILEWGSLCLNPINSEVTYAGSPLTLSRKEYALLELFLRNQQRVYSHSAILHQLWSIADDMPGEETVRAHIKRLRQKLKAAGAADLIETVYGLGYRLNAASGKAPTDHAESQPALENQTVQNQTVQQMADSLDKTAQWKTDRLKLIDRLTVLEQAAQSLLQHSLESDLQQKAEQECHRLIGTFGMLGLSEAATIAQQLEQQLRQNSFSQAQSYTLWEKVFALRQAIESATPTTIVKSRTEARKSEPLRSLLVSDDPDFLNRIIAEVPAQYQAIASRHSSAREVIQRVCPDLVLLDLSESDSAGLSLLEDLSQMPALPVLVFVGNAPVDRGAIARCGGQGFLSKQISLNLLLEVIDRVLERSSEAKVLIVDDDLMFLRLLRALLEPWGLQVTTLNDSLKFWDELTANQPDLLVLDVQMPGINGIELCQRLRNDPLWDWLPILFLTGQKDPTTIQQVFAAGADDYIGKPVVAPELMTRILNRLDRTRLLRKQTEIDALTGLSNRWRSTQEINQFLIFAHRFEQPFCFAVLELDHLKSIHQQYGHAVGDRLLSQVARLLQQAFRRQDIVSRWDGAEFIIGICGITRSDGVKWLTDVLNSLQQMEFAISDGDLLQVTYSIGVAEYPEDGTTLEALYRTASTGWSKGE